MKVCFGRLDERRKRLSKNALLQGRVKLSVQKEVERVKEDSGRDIQNFLLIEKEEPLHGASGTLLWCAEDEKREGR